MQRRGDVLTFFFELFYSHLNLLGLFRYCEYLLIRNYLVVGIFFDNGAWSQDRCEAFRWCFKSFEEIYTFFQMHKKLFDVFGSFRFRDKLRGILRDRSLLGAEDVANTLLLKRF